MNKRVTIHGVVPEIAEAFRGFHKGRAFSSCYSRKGGVCDFDLDRNCLIKFNTGDLVLDMGDDKFIIHEDEYSMLTIK